MCRVALLLSSTGKSDLAPRMFVLHYPYGAAARFLQM
uniref:Uncharacterized protein n=1 Tax=Arundo donax TaxID=35708 RepID=A0A0A8YU45_ARUDO